MRTNKINFVRACSNIIILCTLCLLVFFSVINPDVSVISKENSAYYQGDTSKNEITLMVNVYWGTEFIKPILTELNKYNFKTTFFLGGLWVRDNVELVKEIQANGHEIANHGYLHKDHKTISKSRNMDEIKITEKLIVEIIGIKTNLFAPPSGSYNSDTLDVCTELGYKTIMWSKDTIDWRDKDANIIYNRATKNLNGGDLILMHPTENTLKALPKMLKYYTENKFNVVTVTQNLNLKK